MNRFRIAGAALIASVVPLAGACTNDTNFSGKNQDLQADETTTTVGETTLSTTSTTTTVPVAEPGDVQVQPLPRNELGAQFVQCVTYGSEKQHDLDMTEHFLVTKNGGDIELTLDPSFIAAANVPDSLTSEFESFVKVGGTVVLEPGTEPIELVFGLPQGNQVVQRVDVGVTTDGTITADLLDGSGIATQSLGEGDAALGNVTITPGVDITQASMGILTIDGGSSAVRGMDLGSEMISVGKSFQSADVTSSNPITYSVSLNVPETLLRCTASIGPNYAPIRAR